MIPQFLQVWGCVAPYADNGSHAEYVLVSGDSVSVFEFSLYQISLFGLQEQRNFI